MNVGQILSQAACWTFWFIVMQVVMISHGPINSTIALCCISFHSWMAISSIQNGFFREKAVHDKQQILLSDAQQENSFWDSSWDTWWVGYSPWKSEGESIWDFSPRQANIMFSQREWTSREISKSVWIGPLKTLRQPRS